MHVIWQDLLVEWKSLVYILNWMIDEMFAGSFVYDKGMKKVFFGGIVVVFFLLLCSCDKVWVSDGNVLHEDHYDC